MNLILEKVERIFRIFLYIFRHPRLPQKTKLLLYKVSIRPAIVYAFPIWFSFSPTYALRLEIFERKVLRLCVGCNYRTENRRFSNSYIYEKAGIEPLCRYSLRLLQKFVERTENHENGYIRDVFNSQKDINWSNVNYLSPIGIINENINSDAFNNTLPDFYTRKTPGTRRG